jgi:hypothetical protein
MKRSLPRDIFSCEGPLLIEPFVGIEKLNYRVKNGNVLLFFYLYIHLFIFFYYDFLIFIYTVYFLIIFVFFIKHKL